MKLFAGIIAVAAALECPNDSWEENSTKDACVPVAGTVSVTCNADAMIVTLGPEHLYVGMDDTHEDETTSSAYVGTCTTVTVDSITGIYTMTVDLDDCGTTVTQSAGKITFSNTIYGNDAAVKVDSIITTEQLSLDVSCVYTDAFVVTVDNIGIIASTQSLDGTSETEASSYSTQFSLASYNDDSYTTLTSATSVVIGDPIYNRVSVTGVLPSNIEWVLTGCTAMDAATNHAFAYKIIDDGCLDNLVAAKEETANLRGTGTSPVNFSFNGFTFADNSDTLYLSCSIELCAVANGAFVDSSCGITYGGDNCVTLTDSNTMGYTAAASTV